MTGEHRQWAHATDGSGVVQAGRDVVTIHQSGPASWPERPGMVSVEPPWDRIDHRVRGRSDVMADLVQWAADTADRFVVLCGAGGYGKTTLALHFAREQRGQGTAVWWVSAHDEHSVAAGMREVCFRMGVPPDRIQAAQAGQRSASDLLWSNLRAFPHRWLLVVDNADDAELVIAPRAARPLGPSWLRSTEGCLGSVLVTSRDGGRNSWGPQAVLLHVPALRADDGARILLDLTHRDDDQFAAARAVAARLGGLPLALRLAGLHSASMATAPELPGLPAIRTFSDYLTALDERFMTTIEATSPRHRARREPRELITETWELSLDVLRKGGQVQARALLRLLSCFANAPIPYELLDARIMAGSPLFAGITPDKLLVLLDGLAELGLTERVTTVEQQLPHGPGLVLHPVVRESNRHHHDVKDDPVRYAVLCAALLDSATHDLDHEDSGTWPRWQALVPHCASPLQLWPEAWLGGAEHTDLVRTATATLHRCGRFLYQCGLYEQAEQQLAAALAPQHELLGGEDPDTLKTRGDLASVLTTQGKFDAAEAEFHMVLAAQVRTLGSAHPDTLDTRSRLAVALRARDRLAEAEAEFRAVLTEQVGTLGPEHRHTLDTRNRLAHLLHLQSRITEAEAEFRAVLAARQKLLGEYHLNTLDSRSELASLLHVRGDLPAAEAEYDRLLCAERVALGEDHPKTLVAYSHLVMLRHDQGKLDGLETLYDNILEKQSRVLGPTHLHTLATRHRLAKFHFEQGRLATAQGEFEDVLRQKSRVLGAQHHATLITREYLALTLAARGHTAVAETELETLLEIRLRTMGDDHPLTAATRANLRSVTEAPRYGEVESRSDRQFVRAPARDWRVIWAKVACARYGRVTHWLPLQQHLDDAAAVAVLLVDRWLSPQVVARIAEELPDGIAGVPVLTGWLARVHDVGKASPAFAVQAQIPADRVREAGLVAPSEVSTHPRRSRVHHALVGHLAVQDYLSGRWGPEGALVAEQLASVVGSHHGMPPERSELREAEDHPDLVGRGVWSQARNFFLDRASEGVDLDRYRNVRLSRPVLVLLTSIVVLADWVVSDPELFPLLEGDEDPLEFDPAPRVESGWNKLGLPERWRARALGSDTGAALRNRFVDRAPGALVLQAAAAEVASAATRPGLMIVDAPTGAGKTEAALLAAEELAAKSGADGVFVALPTQAATDAMFERMRRWTDLLPGREGPAGTTLTCGRELFDDATSPVAHNWLSGPVRDVLAAFVVGTIDQVLSAGSKSRHVMLRHLALAGKVVVIDDVHVYDDYMTQYLQRVLHWLGAYKVPVVLLATTLPAQRRAELMTAYEGRPIAVRREPGNPLIVASGGMRTRVLPAVSKQVTVALDRLPDDLETLTSYLREHLTEGGCAVVVRNTVARVQKTAAWLSREFGADNITISHSGFLACDRVCIDRNLVRRFGREGERPGVHIVVASQVVEQALNVDFDLVVTDLAPVYPLVQRMEHVHRYERVRPAPMAQPRCAVVGVEDWSAAPVRAVPESRSIYGEHLLLRSAALVTRLDQVALPSDIAPLVQQAYGTGRLGPTSWQEAMDEAAAAASWHTGQRVQATQALLLDPAGSNARSLVGWVRLPDSDPEDTLSGAVPTSDGVEPLEVLVVQRNTTGGFSTPDWIEQDGGQPLPTDLPLEPAQARVVVACTLRLPMQLSHHDIVFDVIAALKANRVASFDSSPVLRDRLVLLLDENRSTEIRQGKAAFRLVYDPREGLTCESR